MRETHDNDDDWQDLRRYLLGQQPEAEEDRLEERLLAEEELFELAEAAEAELLDECIRGTLAAADCEHLLRRLAASPAGRERLAQAQRLAEILDADLAEPVTLAPAPPNKIVSFPGFFHRPAVRTAFVVLAAGLVGLVVALPRLEKPAAPDRQIAGRVRGAEPHLQAPPPPGTEAPKIALVPGLDVRTASQPANREELPQAATRKPKRQLPTAVLQLAVMTLRGEEDEPELRLTGGGVRIELTLREGEPYTGYEIAVSDEDGAEVWRSPSSYRPPAPGTPLEVRLPARLLKGGDYKVAVRGKTPDGELEDVGFPRFRAVEPPTDH